MTDPVAFRGGRGHPSLICSKCGAERSYSPSEKQYRCYPCRNLRKRHGLSYDDVMAWALTQDNRCAICDRVRVLVIDHNHDCCPQDKSCQKCRRGLLCATCNRMIGLADDNPEILASAARYLQAR